MSEEPQVDNYAFLINVRSLADFESMEVIPGHTARRATDEEIVEIDDTITSLAGGLSRHHIASIWKMRWNETNTQTEPLPRNLWRYFVVAFRGANGPVNDLMMACCLASIELDFGPTIIHSYMNGEKVYGPIHAQGSFFQSTENLTNAGEAAYVDLTADNLIEIAEVWRTLKIHDNNLIDIQGIIMRLYQLKFLPAYSPMRFLGYFAVLESLLTHLPRPQDPYDSITRQVKKKMKLLNKRFRRPLDYAPFGSTEPEKVWGKLYEYRSLIAHGGRPRFDKGPLSCLRSHNDALAFLRSATTAVACQALKEPQLIVDLRDC